MRQMVAVPAAQGGGAGVGKKKLQRRRFNVAVAKDHVGFALMTGVASFGAAKFFFQAISPPQNVYAVQDDSIAALKPVTNCHHIAWFSYFRFRNWRAKNFIGLKAAPFPKSKHICV